MTIRNVVTSIHNRLELFGFDNAGKYYKAHNITPSIKIILSKDDVSLYPEQMKNICDFRSNNKEPSLEYKIIFEAYQALNRQDYRKAIVEAATAVEISITERIKKNAILEALNSSISF